MRKALLVLSIMVAALLFSTTVFASVNDDQVTSQKIREADGTSGQNTNSGSGVKTGHIQNDAVTTGKIANGAVTDVKIGGTISQSKITNLEATLAGKAEVTHNHDVLYQQKYGKLAVVAQTGGDYSDPVTAMNSLATWCGTPSATNLCLLKIMPGVYNLGSNNYLRMSSYVDIEGSGEIATRIIGSTWDYNNYNVGVVVGASNAEIRNLTVENANGYWPSSAIYNNNASPKITNVTANSYGAPTVNHGIRNVNSSPVMMNVTAFASSSDMAYAIMNESSSPVMTNITANATGIHGYGIYNGGNSAPIVTTARVASSRFGIYNAESSAPIITNTITEGGQFGILDVSSSGGVFFNVITSSYLNQGGLTKCINVYDSGYNPIVCP